MTDQDEDRERRIAAHIALFGLTTRVALKQFVFADESRDDVDRLVNRFADSLRLKRHSLPGGGEYFILGEKTRRRFGLRKRPAYNYQGLAIRFGVLGYALAMDVTPFAPAYLAEKFPELGVTRSQLANHYADEDRRGVRRLGYILVDCGRTPPRLATKVRGLIADLSDHPGYFPFIEAGRFVVGIASPTESKSEDVRDRLEEFDGPVSFRVVTVPKLADILLMKPPGRKEEARVQARREEA